MKKAFKDTKVGSFLSNVAPAVINIVGDSIPGGSLLKSIVADKATFTPDQRAEFDRLAAEYENKEMEMLLADRANARDMQKAALAQDDLFSKRFVYYLAGFIFIAFFTMMLLLFFIEIPAGNSEIVYMSFGIFVGVVTTVAAYYYGSADGSKKKEAGIMDVLKSRNLQ